MTQAFGPEAQKCRTVLSSGGKNGTTATTGSHRSNRRIAISKSLGPTAIFTHFHRASERRLRKGPGISEFSVEQCGNLSQMVSAHALPAGCCPGREKGRKSPPVSVAAATCNRRGRSLDRAVYQTLWQAPSPSTLPGGLPDTNGRLFFGRVCYAVPRQVFDPGGRPHGPKVSSMKIFSPARGDTYGSA